MDQGPRPHQAISTPSWAIRAPVRESYRKLSCLPDVRCGGERSLRTAKDLWTQKIECVKLCAVDLKCFADGSLVQAFEAVADRKVPVLAPGPAGWASRLGQAEAHLPGPGIIASHAGAFCRGKAAARSFVREIVHQRRKTTEDSLSYPDDGYSDDESDSQQREQLPECFASPIAPR